MKTVDDFREIWSVDFEYIAPDGCRPDPVCLVAKELRSGRIIRQWRGEFGPVPPYDIGPDSLFVAYTASAEMGCHWALDWPAPANILDLFTEFCCFINHGDHKREKRGLIDACRAYSIPVMTHAHKDSMRARVMAGGWDAAERVAILDYCQEDTEAAGELLRHMQAGIYLPWALLRGRYMAALAAMEWRGVPIDVPTRQLLQERWHYIKDRLITAVDKNYDIFEGTTFKADRFESYLKREGIPWPRHPSGALDLSDDMFKDMSKADLRIAPLRELRGSLSKMRLADFHVGPDGRNRCLLSAFGARSGRNTPSNAKFIFGPSIWLRSLIKPEPGMAVSYLDWSGQELAIAAALSGDVALMEAYESGDPYIAFAKLAGAVPADATKDSHQHQREVFKTCMLGVNYGMGARSFAQRVGISELEAQEILLRHRLAYPRFWEWSQAMVTGAMGRGWAMTHFGWLLQIGHDPNPRSLRNFPMQGGGGDMLRIAAVRALEEEIAVVAPIHDALMVEAAVEQIEEETARMRAVMEGASRTVLDGFTVRVDASIVRYPDRYSDPRGVQMWDLVMKLLEEREMGHAAHG